MKAVSSWIVVAAVIIASLLQQGCAAATTYTFTINCIAPVGTLNTHQFDLGVAKYAAQSSDYTACDVQFTSASYVESTGAPVNIVFTIGSKAATSCLSTMISMVKDGATSQQAFISVVTSLNPAPITTVNSITLQETTTTNAPPDESSDDSSALYIAIGGGVAGGILLIVVVVCVFIRRTEVRRKGDGQEPDALQNPLVDQTSHQHSQPARQHSQTVTSRQDPVASPAKSPSDSPHRQAVAKNHNPPPPQQQQSPPTSSGRIDSAPPVTNSTQAPLPTVSEQSPAAEQQSPAAVEEQPVVPRHETPESAAEVPPTDAARGDAAPEVVVIPDVDPVVSRDAPPPAEEGQEGIHLEQ